SPKYLCGESYGTLRAAGLSEHLQERYGLYLNGLMLISSILDAGTVETAGHNDLPYALFLPTFAAVANYHGRHGERPLRDVLNDAERFALGDYRQALDEGDRQADRAGIVRHLAALTGLSEDFLDRVNLRVDEGRFFAELMRSDRRTVGRL